MPRPAPARPRRRGVRAVALTLAVGCALTGAAMVPAAGASAAEAETAVTTTDQFVDVGAEADGTAVRLDTRLYLPGGSGEPRPAILLAHGFGGSKEDVDDEARRYAADGHVVLAFTARGFGRSGGRIHLNSPDREIADGRLLVDLVAARSEVAKDSAGDPRVAVAGGSYGGAFALMLAAADPRVDATVAAITWHDLSTALFPQAASGNTTPGPYKQLWGTRFFTASFGASASGGAAGGAGGAAASGTPAPAATSSPAIPTTPGTPATPGTTPNNPQAAPADALCGRFDVALCRGLQAAAEDGRPSPELAATLRRNSPRGTIASVTAPTLLIQGEADTLFGLDQADANAAGLAQAGTRHAVRWTDGGHDGASSNPTLDEEAARTWLRTYLAGSRTDPLPVPAFTYSLPVPRRSDTAPVATLDRYPGLQGSPQQTPLRAPESPTVVLTPPGGQPNSMTSVPGLGSVELPTYRLAALPGMSAAFDSATLPRSLTVVGSPTVSLRVTSTGNEATFFVSLWRVEGSDAVQQRALTAPVRVATTPGEPTEVTVNLPPSVWSMAAGSQWRVLVTSTDNSFTVPREARADRITLADATLTLPTAAGAIVPATTERDTESLALVAGIAALLLVIAASALLRWRRRHREHVREDYADIPLVVDHLVKTYADGHRAVDDVSWRAERGQVVGLLGPNGAGKTTTMRMMLGLITPDSGSVHVLGRPVHPGSEILGRVGALVEGPGFLPHLTGRENLKAYWAATGRPADEADLDEAVAVAALGGALDRPVRTYSHGMKQRLGIAQAMLGKPEVLFLDEPTNGLDPPQIAAMRPILQSYAASGRTVVVSSHLLAEVELTCSHVVVMHAGRVVTAGPVADLLASQDTTVFELATADGLEAARDALEGADGILSLETIDEPSKPTLTVVSNRPREEVVRAVVASGAEVVGVGSRRHLEEVFLGVIASSQVRADDGTGDAGLIERLRQVRAR
ncbi:ABC transporter ATP-binding protein [Knoellia sinensis KCTC 19936]|uniref:ABC transporter ATP-binding protein n=1 Tax=Knoellia sinensis KCTC 19936 TaxID=1385520 RepID=A0A0A0J4Z3_9MICO|nr:alpha/beta fold hydrolase [Knoellia sinensis]KGN31152.1 ABC transporter ATP-binding protein [Knoellia sinensis KCTC 19936]